jgi:tRNA(adenine34) deaminase
LTACTGRAFKPGMNQQIPGPMQLALQEAERAAGRGEVPVGAVVAGSAGEILASSGNRTVELKDPTAHAELLVIREAARALGSERLVGCDLYVTLEPCAMCAGAIVLGRVSRVVIGAWDPKAGMAGSVGDLLRHPRLNHRPEVAGGVLEEECGALLRDFFTARRRAEFVDTPPAAG